jgi:MoxR-like ATPase
VTAGETMYKLPDPFFVLATQNPVEQEGTYPLPEAQLDRFLFMIRVGYPTAEQELEIMKRISGSWQSDLVPLLTGEDILKLQQIVRRVPAADHVFLYARDLVRLTRPDDPKAPSFIKEWVQWGAGPRAGIGLMLAAKARAILRGRYHATTGDVRALAAPVLRHRLVANFNAEASGVSTDDIVARLLETVTPAVEDPLS